MHVEQRTVAQMVEPLDRVLRPIGKSIATQGADHARLHARIERDTVLRLQLAQQLLDFLASKIKLLALSRATICESVFLDCRLHSFFTRCIPLRCLFRCW